MIQVVRKASARGGASMGAVGRCVSFVAATALFVVSVQVGVMANCSLCPSDCPMHAKGTRGRHAAAKGKSKLGCHSAASTPASADPRYSRPPCKTTYTLAGATLPPVILAEVAASSADPRDRGIRGEHARRPANHCDSPETPPPVRLV